MDSEHRIAAWTGVGCAALLGLFSLLAWTAVAGKCATADESYHALAGWLHLWQHDDRFDCEHPPLFNTWAALANGPLALAPNAEGYRWSGKPLDTGSELVFTVDTLYRTPGNDGARFVMRERAMMLIVGVLLGAGIAGVSWRWCRAGGGSAGMAAMATLTACGLYSLDPNFLAHAPLVKNDVPTAAATLAIFASVWAVGRRLSAARVILLGVACGVALAVKYSAIGIDAIAIGLLCVRAVLPWPWVVSKKRRLERAHARAAAAGAASAAVIAIAIGVLWAAYGLRFGPAAGAEMDLQPLRQRVIEACWQARQPGNSATPPTPTAAELRGVRLPTLARLASFAADHRLLPQAFVGGLLFTEQSTMVWPSFLCGRFSRTGWWWYFPFAMGVKTPTATLLLGIVAAAVGLWWWRSGRARPGWTTLCWAVPSAAYLCIIMSANLNLGFRHVLTIYPLLFVAIGLAMARLWSVRRRTAALVLVVVGVGLAWETAAAYPNYIPFFNVMAGGSRGGLRWLSDSNLDWGQDLPLLAAWQRGHPEEKLYLAYFGTADPAYYGIQYTNLPGGYALGPAVGQLDSPGVIAIGATLLQGTYDRDRSGRSLYWWLAGQKPIDVLGGSIYLFAFPPESGGAK